MTGHVWNPWDALSKVQSGDSVTEGLAPHRGPGPPQRAEREPAVSTAGTQQPGARRLLREDVEAAGRRELTWES